MVAKRQTRARKTAARSAKAVKRDRPAKRTVRGRKTAPPSSRRWSGAVTRNSDAMDLEDRVFKGSASEIARSLKRSAERSRRRKSTPYRSAMSMLTFYINRGGRNLSASRRRTLEAAKGKLREAFDK